MAWNATRVGDSQNDKGASAKATGVGAAPLPLSLRGSQGKPTWEAVGSKNMAVGPACENPGGAAVLGLV